MGLVFPLEKFISMFMNWTEYFFKRVMSPHMCMGQPFKEGKQRWKSAKSYISVSLTTALAVGCLCWLRMAERDLLGKRELDFTAEEGAISAPRKHLAYVAFSSL